MQKEARLIDSPNWFQRQHTPAGTWSTVDTNDACSTSSKDSCTADNFYLLRKIDGTFEIMKRGRPMYNAMNSW